MTHAAADIELFDGQRIDGWSMAGDGEVAHVDGVLETRGGMGLLWYSERPFRDFVLTVQWRAFKPSDNAGVFVRFPDPRGDPWNAVREGYEVQILDDAASAEERTGAIYTFAGPDDVLSFATGRWNRLEIRAEGQDYTVAVNGQVATRFRGDREETGFVGLQNHDATSRVQFREVRIRELATT